MRYVSLNKENLADGTFAREHANLAYTKQGMLSDIYVLPYFSVRTKNARMSGQSFKLCFSRVKETISPGKEVGLTKGPRILGRENKEFKLQKSRVWNTAGFCLFVRTHACSCVRFALVSFVFSLHVVRHDIYFK